jgi:hypothetical protein
MIRLDVEQGSAAWFAARAGLPTASNFDKLITPKTLKPSAQNRGYRNHLLAEWLLGEAIVEEGSQFMGRGQDLEAEARDWYEMERGQDVELGGFCLRDDRRTGCSPDGFVGTDGLVQIKVPSAANHVGYLLDGLGDQYRLQLQGELWVCDRTWCDFVSYNPKLPAVLLRIERDEEVIQAIQSAVDQFADELAASREILLGMGLAPRKRAEPQALFVGVG